MKQKLIPVEYIETTPSKVLEGIANFSTAFQDEDLFRLFGECERYSADVLGTAIYAPWLLLYSLANNGELKSGWLPGGYFHSHVSPSINGKYGELSHLGGLPKVLFDVESFPDRIYSVNGVFLDRSGRIVSDSQVKAVLFEYSDNVVFKKDFSSEGRGIEFVSIDDFDLDVVKKYGNGHFQSEIKQHAFFNEITPNSVATIRVVTVVGVDNLPEVKACYLRVSSGMNERYVSSKTQISIPVNIEDGSIWSVGYDINYQTFTNHPETNFIFAKKNIPNFQRIKETVSKLHEAIPFIRLVGWDVTINRDDRVEIIEWNAKSPSVTFIEATQGPCFSGLGWEQFWRSNG